MRTFLQAILFTLLSLSAVFAQTASILSKAVPFPTITSEHFSAGGARIKSGSYPKQPLSPQISVSGAVDIGIAGKWPIQSNKGGLHNLQIDPSNTSKIHVVIMQDLDVNEDTIATDYFVNRNAYYLYSGDGGATWSAPKAISTGRTGYPVMIMMERNGVYVPVIAAHTQNEAGDVTSSLYLEQGAPGDGNFKEILTDFTNYSGDTRQIIWPSIALASDGSKVYIIASSFRTSATDPYDFLQFGYFTLDAQKTDAVWSGWKQGPAAGTEDALAIGGLYRIVTTPSGKIGIVWKNTNYDAGILNMFYSESNDGGSIWSVPKSFFEAIPAPSTGSYEAQSGFDLFYDNDVPVVVFGAYATDLAGSYFPASGSIWFWRGDMSFAAQVLSRNTEGFNLEDFPPAIQMDELSFWDNNTGINPTGPNVDNPTVGIMTGDPKKFTIFFDAWIQDDIATLEIPDEQYTALPFSSIYKVWTLDGGSTWKGPQAVRANDISAPQENHLDYREAQVSTYNSPITGGVRFNMLLSVDSSAGLWQVGGYPNFSDVHYFYQTEEFSRAKQTSTPTFSLEQNYPNPVVSGKRTIVPLSLAGTEYVTLTVTDVMGREIANVFSGQLAAGSHELTISTQAFAAGVYQYVVRTSDATLARAFTVTK